jgi:tetratricopeptide (TPR) repeat protein
VSKPSVQSAAPRHQRWRTAVLMLALAAIAIGSGALWLRQARIVRVRAIMPPVPATITNEPLRDRLAKARAEAGATGRLSALAELGRLYHANGLLPEAETCWRLLIREQPGEARWHYYLADLRRIAGDYSEAEEQLQLTVAADPGAAIAWLQLAEMKFKSGRYAAADADYRRRLNLLPDDPYAALGLARLAQLQGQIDEARRGLEDIVKKHPKFSAAHNLYAELEAATGHEDLADLHRWLGREAGRFREADDPWMDEVNAVCYDPKRLCLLGTIAYQTGRGDLGRAQFERAVSLAPTDPTGYQLLGELLLQSGAAEAAREILNRGLVEARVAVPTSTHYLKLSEACRTLGRISEARQVLSDGLARHPGSAELYHALGNQLANDGKPAEAIAAYRSALEFDPAFAEADFSLALTLLAEDRQDEAAQALHHALQLQPTYPKALLLLSRLELDAHRPEAASEYLLPLLKANPGVPEIRQIVARWHFLAGQAAEKTDAAVAERHYREGLILQPEHAGLNLNLGVMFLLADRTVEAVPLLETSRRLEPGNPQTAFFLGQAYARSGRLEEARQVLKAGLKQAEQAGQAATARNFREILSLLP